MQTRIGVFVAFAMACMAANAEEVLAGTVGAAGASAAKLVCSVFNADETAITIKSKEIIGQFDSPPNFYYDDCPKSLSRGKICSYAANIENNQQYGCRVTFLGSKRSIRGSISFTDQAGAVLTSA